MVILGYLFFGFCLFAACTGVAILITYIKELNTRLRTTNTGNMKLLDCMHEGVLILSKGEHEVMFANKPAKKLISTFIDKADSKNFLTQEIF